MAKQARGEEGGAAGALRSVDSGGIVVAVPSCWKVQEQHYLVPNRERGDVLPTYSSIYIYIRIPIFPAKSTKPQ